MTLLLFPPSRLAGFSQFAAAVHPCKVWVLRIGARMRIRSFCAAVLLASAIGSPAWADDFCVTLKTAVAAAKTNFTNIPGPNDDFMPGWRDAKLSLPFAVDCNVDTDKRGPSYFCSWEKEQGAAVNARYKYMVRQTDQCLAGFQKSTADQITTWHNSTAGTVTVDARHVMPNTQTWAVMLTVKR
jgi:hypothetical protein